MAVLTERHLESSSAPTSPKRWPDKSCYKKSGSKYISILNILEREKNKNGKGTIKKAVSGRSRITKSVIEVFFAKALKIGITSVFK